MCGIAGLLLSPRDLQHVSVDELVKTLGLEIEQRGKDATGVARLTASNRVHVTKAPVTATQFFLQHPGIGSGCRVALVHTRAWTTGSPKVNANNHPITSGPITGIHNGMVSNDDGLFARHGWLRVAEVDSEAIFTAIHHLGWKEAMETLEGSIACAWMDFDQPGHLFVVRHTSSPLHIGITESGSVLFASTNAAVAKAATLIGSSCSIDMIKEGVLCEFWTDDEGVLKSNVEQFAPPKPLYSRTGAWEYDGGAWFRSGTRPKFPTRTPSGTTTGTTRDPHKVKEWRIGAEGYVLHPGDNVVFCPVDKSYEPTFGRLMDFGVKLTDAYVQIELDWGVEDEITLPVRQLLPQEVWEDRHRPRQLALPPVTVVSEIEQEEIDAEVLDSVSEIEALRDFYHPRSTLDMVNAIEEIFGEAALDLIPGYHEWESGEITGWELTDDVIDVEEVNTDG